MRLYSACIVLAPALLLVACRYDSPPLAKEQKKSSGRPVIRAGDSFATSENCGLIHYVRPVYPQKAKRQRIQGIVRLTIRITKTGEVSEVNLVSGDPALAPSAIAAVKKWRYAPCRFGAGEPIERKTQADVQFTLNQ